MEKQFSFHLRGDSNIKLSEQSSRLLSGFISNLIEVEKVNPFNIKVEGFCFTGVVSK